ncbi:hypothetical protein [Isoptericola dokdonensis]|jgi:hypothetical protein|uniref:Uncharacterized protein n=1 Tax=Isoptericola dokdonensis DS-3 TaxID=1300344 RepID=A0A168EXJ4_9MICO|nr:hypothetical protein [Isoptericola dokdonensis]ANC30608.1 hypothetical protein I598_1039 [Isoptericola dokdonensis DS-3]
MGHGHAVRQERRHTTTIVTDYFAAPTDALAATVVHTEDGPSTPARGSGEPLFDTVRMPSVEPFVMLGSLAEAVCRRPYGEVTADPRHGFLVGGQDDGPFVVAVSGELSARLAASAPHELAEAARRWAAGRALDEPGSQRLATAVVALGELAWRAADVRHSLYCWAKLPGPG